MIWTNLLYLLLSTAWAVCPSPQPTNTDCVLNGSNKNITVHSQCRKVTNAHATGKDLMIPLLTSTEWSTFYGNPPTGVTVGSCTPTITSISPIMGLAAGGYSITLTGTGFASGLTVKINGTNCTSSGFTNSTTATCTVPAATAGFIGRVDVEVVNADTLSGTLTNGFYYLGAPKVWLRADAGVSPATGTVTTWSDQSGNSNHAIDAGAAPSITTSSASFNNMPVITFNGSEVLELPENNPLLRAVPGATTVFAMRPTATSDDQTFLTITNGSSGEARFTHTIKATTARTNVGSSGTGDFYMYAQRQDTTAQLLRGGTLVQNSAMIYVGIANYSTRAAEIAINGTVVSSSTTLGASGANTASSNSLNVLLGADDYFDFFNGDIAEVFVYAVALTTAQRNTLETYLRARYNLP